MNEAKRPYSITV